MVEQPSSPFDHVSRSAGGHFVLNLYAAIYRLIHQTRRLAAFGGAELEELTKELEAASAGDEDLAHLAEEFAEEAKELEERAEHE